MFSWKISFSLAFVALLQAGSIRFVPGLPDYQHAVGLPNASLAFLRAWALRQMNLSSSSKLPKNLQALASVPLRGGALHAPD